MKKLIPGTRYQYYDKKEDKVGILIIQGSVDKGTIFDTLDHKETVLDKLEFNSEEFNNKYVEIIPDGFVNIMITDVDTNPDLYVCLNKASDLSNNKKSPSVIARQYLYNNLKAMTDGKVWLGDCISTVYNYDNSDSIESYFEFETIGLTNSVAVYVDSTIDDIVDSITDINKFNDFLKWLKNDTSKKANDTNENLNKSMESFEDITKELDTNLNAPKLNFNVEGLCDNIKEFLESVNFMMHFRATFNITQVDWPVDLRRYKYEFKEDLKLNGKQIKKLEDLFRMHILNPIVIKYDKDIDVSKIISKKHLLLSDSTYTIYLIAYDEGEPYIQDEDILKAMNVK